MEVATGKSILNGIAIGRLKLYRKEGAASSASAALTPQEEWKRFEAARIQAQEQLDGGEEEEFSPAEALKTAAALKREPDIPGFLDYFKHLEILTEQWKKLLNQPHSPSLPRQTRDLARYLTERYWLQAVSDYDLVCRV